MVLKVGATLGLVQKTRKCGDREYKVLFPSWEKRNNDHDVLKNQSPV